MNPYTVSGIFVGVIIGFIVGREWSEYFRARAIGQDAMRTRQVYRGRSAAWYAGATLIVGGTLLFGYLIPA